jgi:hypothetical protein
LKILMPTIACPGCGKKYNVPATAAGQVAKCACGKRFKLAGPAASKPSATTVVDVAHKTAPAAKVRSAKIPAAAVAKPVAPVADDDFWDDALREEVSALPVETKAAPTSAALMSATAGSTASSGPQTGESAPKKKRKKRSVGIKWGFDWGKVVAGTAAFLVFGGLAVALFLAGGRIKGVIYLAIPAMGGLFTAINGLMGEEGIW